MRSDNRFRSFLIALGVAFLQLIMTQVVTFLGSLLFPRMESVQQDQPLLFGLFVSFAFSVGVYLVGWLALKLHWLRSKPLYLWRLAGTLIGAFLPILIAVLIWGSLEPGNPSFFISMICSILGFFIPGWIARK